MEESTKWKVLVVDDDKDVQLLTKVSLKGFNYEGKELNLLIAGSAEEAKKVIRENPDVALILLDVVMETNHAGLDLVQYIREEIKNKAVRIILRTGYPGEAPEHLVIRKFDINDYELKTECTPSRLQTRIYTGIRDYINIIGLKKREEDLLSTNRKCAQLNKQYQEINAELAEALERAEESERKFKGIFYQTPTGKVLFDVNGNFVDCNSAILNMIGLHSSEQIKKLNLFELKGIPDEYKNKIREGKEFHFEMYENFEEVKKNTFPDTTRERMGYFDCFITAFKADDNLIKGFLIHILDITDRKLMEQQLKESESLLELIIANAPIGIWILDEKGKIVSGNAAAQKIWEGARYVGIDEFHEYRGWWVNTGELIKSDEWAAARAIRKGESSLNEEIEIECFDGSHKIILNSVVPIHNETKGIIGALIVNEDITERKNAEEALRESEERLRLANKATNDVVWDWDIINDSQRWNEAGKVVFGWTEIVEHSVSAEWWVERVHPQDRQRIEEGFFAVINSNKNDYWSDEYRFLKADGNYVQVIDRGYVLRDKQGKAFRMIGAMLDISERKQSEEDRLKLHNLESLGMLAGGIAHDFNNILASILGYVSIAIEDVDDPGVKKNLYGVEKAALRAAALAKQLLTFAKGGAPFKKIFDVQKLILDITNFALSGSNITATFNFKESFSLNADPEQISQVIQNILLNAKEAMPNGGEVSISVTDLEDENSNALIKITIRDNGCGITHENIHKIFDPYYSTKGAGRGLGLSICHSIINRHDGKIFVDSFEERGTTFTILLPAMRESVETEQKNERDEGKSFTILIMDDEEALRDSMKSQLTRLGHKVKESKDGEEAIKFYKDSLLKNQKINLVILDLTIKGGLGGRETLKQLRELNPSLKAIATSGYSKDLENNYLEYGFDEMLPKPYTKEELKNKILKIM